MNKFRLQRTFMRRKRTRFLFYLSASSSSKVFENYLTIIWLLLLLLLSKFVLKMLTQKTASISIAQVDSNGRLSFIFTVEHQRSVHLIILVHRHNVIGAQIKNGRQPIFQFWSGSCAYNHWFMTFGEFDFEECEQRRDTFRFACNIQTKYNRELIPFVFRNFIEIDLFERTCIADHFGVSDSWCRRLWIDHRVHWRHIKIVYISPKGIFSRIIAVLNGGNVQSATIRKHQSASRQPFVTCRNDLFERMVIVNWHATIHERTIALNFGFWS